MREEDGECDVTKVPARYHIRDVVVHGGHLTPKATQGALLSILFETREEQRTGFD